MATANDPLIYTAETPFPKSTRPGRKTRRSRGRDQLLGWAIQHPRMDWCHRHVTFDKHQGAYCYLSRLRRGTDKAPQALLDEVGGRFSFWIEERVGRGGGWTVACRYDPPQTITRTLRTSNMSESNRELAARDSEQGAWLNQKT